MLKGLTRKREETAEHTNQGSKLRLELAFDASDSTEIPMNLLIGD